MKIALSLSALLFSNANAASWSYTEKGNNASHWDHHAAECGYDRQSPIDLDMTGSCEEPLLLDWTSQETHYVIQNNGHSLQATPFLINHKGGADLSSLEVLGHNNDTQIRLKNSFYMTYNDEVHKEYCFNSLHFHWGSGNGKGSEHTVNGEHFPLEVHLVHYACDFIDAGEAIGAYISGEEAANYDDENILAVIGVLFEIGAPNPVLDEILDDMILDGIYAKREKPMGEFDDTELLELYYTHFNPADLLPASREMVAYLGSLTTPPCLETVRWHVMKETMTVSPAQMEQFRLLLSSEDLNDTMAPNFRPVQALNGRKMYKCQADVDEDMVTSNPSSQPSAAPSLPTHDPSTTPIHLTTLTGNGTDVDVDSDTDGHYDDDGHHAEEDTAGTLKIIFIAFGLLFAVVALLLIGACMNQSKVRRQQSQRNLRYASDHQTHGFGYGF